MNQIELLKRSLDFEAFVTRKWPEYSDSMRYCALQSRNRFLKELLEQQLKEFLK